jgi:biotin synthase
MAAFLDARNKPMASSCRASETSCNTASQAPSSASIGKWQTHQIEALYDSPFMDLIFQAQKIHRENFPSNQIQASTLLSIKTGTCPEDCAYCPQSGHYKTGVEKQKLMPLSDVIEAAKAAKESGASRFCMGAAWRSPTDAQIGQVNEMVKAVKALGLETCATLGMLTPEQAESLKQEGLDYYNHNLDTSPDFYKEIITTRTYEDRLDTLHNVRNAGIKVCCGGILGMGETKKDRIALLQELANLPTPPESVPINKLIPIPGTPLGNATPVDNLDFVRTIAVARILMPTSYVRLSAGRESMSEELQVLCFLAGANSVFFGEKLLTAKNPDKDQDLELFQKLGLKTC